MTDGPVECCMHACTADAVVEVRERIGINADTRAWRPYCPEHKRQKVRGIE